MSETITKTYRFHFHPKIILSVKHEVSKVFECHGLSLEPEVIDEMINKLEWESCCTGYDEDFERLKQIEEYKAKEDWKNDTCDLCYPCFTSVITDKTENRIKRQRRERRKLRKQRNGN